MRNDPMFLVVDLFCGAGGTTTGFAQAELAGSKLVKIIAAVNHDPKAIKSHWRNHPDVVHFEEDIRSLDLTELEQIVIMARRKYPNAYLILWASLECTNFSKAKGGQPRDADSRTLADHLPRYIAAIQPDYIQIENVVEFMSWGPLNEHGKPVSRKNGSEWLRWRRTINVMGYTDQWREMNSANYGAYTSRNRLFGIFAKNDLPVVFPEPTHAKAPSKFSMHGDLHRWKAVREVLDFQDEGESIFNRKKDLSPKTMERILAGLIKYVATGDTAFISKYFSGKPKGKVNSVHTPAGTITTVGNQTLVQTKSFSDVAIDQPVGALTTIDHHALLQAKPFLLQNYAADSKGANVFDVDKPARTVTTRDSTQIVSPQFLTHYYSNGGETSSVDQPCPAVTCMDGKAVIQPQFFIDKHFGSKSQNQSIEAPAGALLPNDKHRLVKTEPFLMPTNFDNPPRSLDEPAPTLTASRRHHYIVNPSHGGHCTSTAAPCPVIVARQDKAPLYLVQAIGGQFQIPVYDTDCEAMVEVKRFMAHYKLVDIKMRMLRVTELLRIQGFPQDYHLEGNQSDQKKFIGNSVVPHIVKSWTEALAMRLLDAQTKVA